MVGRGGEREREEEVECGGMTDGRGDAGGIHKV